MRKIKIGGKNGICKTNALTLSQSDNFKNILYLDTSSLTRNCISKIQMLSRNEAPSRAQRLVTKNTILYSNVRPNLEHFGIIENPADNMIVSTGFTTLDVVDQHVDPKYLYYKLTQKHITRYLHSIAETSVSSYPSINPSDLENLLFDIPDNISTQRKISAVLSSLDSKIELNNRINDNLPN